MHLPYSSVFPSCAVSVHDSRGARGIRDYQGTFAMTAPPRSADSTIKRRATAIHDVDHSISSANGAHRPFKDATTTRLLASNSSSRVVHQSNDRPASWGSNAFTGSTSQMDDVMRTTQVKPSIVLGGTPMPCLVTRHPCDDVPGPGKYDPQIALSHSFANTAQFGRPARGCPRVDRKARISSNGGTPPVSSQPRLVDTTSHMNHAKASDATPGPGAYPGSEWSDFAPRVRTIRCFGRLAAQASIGLHQEHLSVRPSTSSFGSDSRSDIRMEWVGGPQRNPRVLGLPERSRTLSSSSRSIF